MNYYLQAIYNVIGCIFLLCISLWGIVFAIFKITELIKDRKDERLKSFVLSELSQYDRWCGYEFPQIAELCKTLEAQIKNGWSIGQHDTFRENLRKKFNPKNSNKPH